MNVYFKDMHYPGIISLDDKFASMLEWNIGRIQISKKQNTPWNNHGSAEPPVWRENVQSKGTFATSMIVPGSVVRGTNGNAPNVRFDQACL